MKKKQLIRIDEIEVDNKEEQAEPIGQKSLEEPTCKKVKDIPKDEALWAIKSRVCNWCSEKYPWQDCVNCTLRKAMNDIATYEKPRTAGCYVPMRKDEVTE